MFILEFVKNFMGKNYFILFKKLKSILLIFFILFLPLNTWQCSSTKNNNEKNPMTKPSIKEVIEKHSNEIMSIAGVVGIYQGETDDGKPCIKVMVEKKSKALEKKIPKTLEGYPVLIDVTGKIKPMN